MRLFASAGPGEKQLGEKQRSFTRGEEGNRNPPMLGRVPGRHPGTRSHRWLAWLSLPHILESCLDCLLSVLSLHAFVFRADGPVYTAIVAAEKGP